ncbi:MAG: hypothetical protein HC834_01800 [Rhodospirillales bacterium]|nr:hypothetical protein [Rhodospirillales bacterium]
MPLVFLGETLADLLHEATRKRDTGLNRAPGTDQERTAPVSMLIRLQLSRDIVERPLASHLYPPHHLFWNGAAGDPGCQASALERGTPGASRDGLTFSRQDVHLQGFAVPTYDLFRTIDGLEEPVEN